MADRIFCIMGPTASGKTALACDLVQRYPFEIISVDSGMVYRGMDIGTAKPDIEVLNNAPHWLLDIIDPIESYSAAQFCDDVLILSQDIIERGKIPLLVGGTMMYFRALQQGLSPLPSANEVIRQQLLQEAQQQGWLYLYQQLTQVDPIAAAKIHPHDTQRIQRALEVYHLTGKPLSNHWETEKKAPYSFTNFILFPDDRSWLHDRIAQRFQAMLAQGFVAEVEALQKQWYLTMEHPSMRSVGYRQVLSYLQGKDDYATMIEKGVAATRQLGKRQLTWLRHWPDGFFYPAENMSSADNIIAKIFELLDNPTN